MRRCGAGAAQGTGGPRRRGNCRQHQLPPAQLVAGRPFFGLRRSCEQFSAAAAPLSSTARTQRLHSVKLSAPAAAAAAAAARHCLASSSAQHGGGGGGSHGDGGRQPFPQLRLCGDQPTTSNMMKTGKPVGGAGPAGAAQCVQRVLFACCGAWSSDASKHTLPLRASLVMSKSHIGRLNGLLPPLPPA